MFFYSSRLRLKTNFMLNKRKSNSKGIKLNKYKTINTPKVGYNRLYINIPNFWKISLVKGVSNKLVIYLYNEVYYFNITLSSQLTYLNFDVNSRTFLVKTLGENNFFRTYYTLHRKIFDSFTLPFFTKIKFKGKGYYIFKNVRQTITPQFGHSHRLYIYSYFTSVVFLSKTSIFLFGLSSNDMVKVSRGIKNMRPINIFTGRGVRFSKQVIYRKQGKVSSYR